MTWHYQVRSRTDHGEPLYDIVEQYGKPCGYTVNSSAPVAESKAQLILCLERMIRDAKRYRVIREKEPS